MTIPRKLPLAVVLAAALTLGACADKPSEGLDSVSFKVTPAANDTAPVAVDVVYVRDQKLVETLATLNAIDWFARREQIRRDNPATVEVLSWELVPGQTLTAPVPDLEPAWAVLVYANYAAPGPHRLRIVKTRTLSLTVGDKDVEPAP